MLIQMHSGSKPRSGTVLNVNEKVERVVLNIDFIFRFKTSFQTFSHKTAITIFIKFGLVVTTCSEG